MTREELIERLSRNPQFKLVTKWDGGAVIPRRAAFAGVKTTSQRLRIGPPAA
jgi:hypothetical protein